MPTFLDWMETHEHAEMLIKSVEKQSFLVGGFHESTQNENTYKACHRMQSSHTSGSHGNTRNAKMLIKPVVCAIFPCSWAQFLARATRIPRGIRANPARDSRESRAGSAAGAFPAREAGRNAVCESQKYPAGSSGSSAGNGRFPRGIAFRGCESRVGASGSSAGNGVKKVCCSDRKYNWHPIYFRPNHQCISYRYVFCMV